MNLILQGPGLSRADVDAIADGVRPASIAQVNQRAFRLKSATPHDSVAKLCEARRMDFAWIPEGRRLADLKLVAMDMDSTLITIECIDELGGYAGKKAEIAAITEAAMRGEIADYKESLRRRVTLLAGVPVAALEEVYTQRLRLNPGAETLVRACQAAGLKTLLVSGGFTFFTDRLRERLRLDFTRSNVLGVEDGRLDGTLVDQPWGDICDGAEKRKMLLETCTALGIGPKQSIAMGDGANDLPMMGAAGLSVAYHAKPAVREQAMVSIESGGLDRLLEVVHT